MENNTHPTNIKPQRNIRLIIVVLVILLCLISTLFYWWKFSQHWVETNDAYVTGNVVFVRALTSGTVTEIKVENTQYVRDGDVVIRLDGQHSAITLEQAKAELADTVRKIATEYKQLAVLRHKIVSLKASETRLQHDLERYRHAVRGGGVSAQQLQNTEDQINEIRANIQQIQLEIQAAETTLQGTNVKNHPTVLKAREAVKKAYLDYVRKDVIAPASGYVAKRKVQIGEHVQVGNSLFAIVPLDYLWIEANVKETDLAKIRTGQDAEVRVDAQADNYIYHGKVEGINPGTGSIFALLPPENASGNYIHIVERVPIRIALAKEELKERPLRPGLSTVTRIDISNQENENILGSMVSLNSSIYHTDVYHNELGNIDELIESIIDKNLTTSH